MSSLPKQGTIFQGNPSKLLYIHTFAACLIPKKQKWMSFFLPSVLWTYKVSIHFQGYTSAQHLQSCLPRLWRLGSLKKKPWHQIQTKKDLLALICHERAGEFFSENAGEKKIPSFLAKMQKKDHQEKSNKIWKVDDGRKRHPSLLRWHFPLIGDLEWIARIQFH